VPRFFPPWSSTRRWKAVNKASAGSTVPEVRLIFERRLRSMTSRPSSRKTWRSPRRRQGRRFLRLRQGNPPGGPGLSGAEVPRTFAVSLPPVLLALQKRLQHEFSRPAVARPGAHPPQFLGRSQRAPGVSGRFGAQPGRAHLLYEGLSTLPEGDLSRVRANLVKQDTLAPGAAVWGWPRCCAWARAKCARAGNAARPSWPTRWKP
jgi:hypothetical protein